MNREIEFRIWHKKEKRMMPVDKIFFDGYGGFEVTSGDHEAIDHLEADLMQFIGQYARATKKIFEGDLLVHEEDRKKYDRIVYEVCYGLDAMEKSIGFYLKPHASNDKMKDSIYMSEPPHASLNRMRVIGNRFANPELLKQ